jgi:hypothetical protein
MLETKHDYCQFGSSPGPGAKSWPIRATPQSVAFGFMALAHAAKISQARLNYQRCFQRQTGYIPLVDLCTFPSKREKPCTLDQRSARGVTFLLHKGDTLCDGGKIGARKRCIR